MFSDRIVVEDCFNVEVNCTDIKSDLECYTQIRLKELPETLMMHLQFIDYDNNNGANKILKDFEFTIDLQLEPSEYLLITYF